MQKKRLLWALVGLLLISVLGLSWAPLAIRSYVERHYPGISVQRVVLHWGYVTFGHVTVDRPNVQATLDVVTADWDHNVHVRGGTLTLTFSKQHNEETHSSQSITGEDLTVDVRNLLKEGATAHLTGVGFDSDQVSFRRADLSYEAYRATLHDGHYIRHETKLRAHRVEVPLTLPFEIPKMAKEQKVELQEVEVWGRNLKFEGAILDPFFKVTKHSEALLAEDLLSADLEGLEVNHPWVSPDPVTFQHVRIVLDRSKRYAGFVQLNKKGTISVDPMNYHLQGHESCDAWVESLPEPLPEALSQARGHFLGDLSFEVKRDPAPQLNIHSTCRFECAFDPIRTIRGQRFTYMAYDKNDQLFARDIGPWTKDWTPFESLPAFVPKAFVTMEDPGFWGHRGILVQALENSLKDNLALGKFFRGGSTISMQLSKNLWLRRHKTIGRKAQEALLTLALESCLTKQQILELYLNAVEFGPNLYGIGPAAKHYFDKSPAKLEPEEAFYLASILPHPRNAIMPESGGLRRVRGLMKVLAQKGFISDGLIPVDDVDSSGWSTE